MNKWNKKPQYIIILMLLFVFILPFFTTTVQGVSKNQFEEGDYIAFGSYNKEPILWRAIHKDTDGNILLFSEKILCFKPFDANGDGVDYDGDGKNDFKPQYFLDSVQRLEHGSNYWAKSNIREWLNSDSKKVKYSHQPPDDDHVSYSNLGNYSFETEAGFLSNFTQAEKDLIKPVSHKALLNFEDQSVKTGGNEAFSAPYNESLAWKGILGNHEKAFYHNVHDKVFLLDIKELVDYVSNKGYNCLKSPTEQAIKKADFKSNRFTGTWKYWLSTPYSDTYRVLIVKDDSQYIFCFDADCGPVGVVPALYIKPEATVSTGSGKLNDPYIIKGGSNAANGVNVQVEQKADANPIKVVVNGKQLTFDVPPVLINGRTMFPLRAIFEELGAQVQWNSATSTVTGIKGSTTVTLQIDNAIASVNDNQVKLDCPACIINGRTLVPGRFVAESLGAAVSWDPATRTITIDTISTVIR